MGYGWGTGELNNINKMRRVEKETRETKRKRERRGWGTVGVRVGLKYRTPPKSLVNYKQTRLVLSCLLTLDLDRTPGYGLGYGWGTLNFFLKRGQTGSNRLNFSK